MKLRWSHLLTLVAGVLVGAAVAMVLLARHYNRMFEDWYLMGVVEQAHIARQINTGAGSSLVTDIERSLPGYVLAVESQFGRAERTLPALCSTRDDDDDTGTPVPAEVARLLASLPPTPAGCCDVEKPALR